MYFPQLTQLKKNILSASDIHILSQIIWNHFHIIISSWIVFYPQFNLVYFSELFCILTGVFLVYRNVLVSPPSAFNPECVSL